MLTACEVNQGTVFFFAGRGVKAYGFNALNGAYQGRFARTAFPRVAFVISAVQCADAHVEVAFGSPLENVVLPGGLGGVEEDCFSFGAKRFFRLWSSGDVVQLLFVFFDVDAGFRCSDFLRRKGL